LTALIDLTTIASCPVTHEPFDFFAVENVLTAGALQSIRDDFPLIEKPGLYPIGSVNGGPAFNALVETIRGTEFSKLIGHKFDVDLEGLPMMITIRGMAQQKDGRIHCDSKDKVVTCLLYLNEQWDAAGGRLRMLRNERDIEDYAAEIPAHGGSFAAFRVTPQSWHGHKPFVGERRYLMFNWIRSDEALRHHERRHSLSARIKKLIPAFYKGH
jgi:SM-20-related protein